MSRPRGFAPWKPRQKSLELIVETVRLAVTPEQVESYQLPTAPPKKTDRRQFSGGNLTTQCESLDPQTLAAIVRKAIESRQDEDIRQSRD